MGDPWGAFLGVWGLQHDSVVEKKIAEKVADTEQTNKDLRRRVHKLKNKTQLQEELLDDGRHALSHMKGLYKDHMSQLRNENTKIFDDMREFHNSAMKDNIAEHEHSIEEIKKTKDYEQTVLRQKHTAEIGNKNKEIDSPKNRLATLEHKAEHEQFPRLEQITPEMVLNHVKMVHDVFEHNAQQKESLLEKTLKKNKATIQKHEAVKETLRNELGQIGEILGELDHLKGKRPDHDTHQKIQDVSHKILDGKDSMFKKLKLDHKKVLGEHHDTIWNLSDPSSNRSSQNSGHASSKKLRRGLSVSSSSSSSSSSFYGE